MQPEFSPQNHRGAEVQPPVPGYSYEVPPNFASQEIATGQSFEAPIDSPERALERSPVELAPPPPVPMMPAPPNPVPPVMDQPAPVSVSNPASADDDDVIEKEWVDRAKQIISQTRNDPSARERALGALQRDYLFKRYGKQLGVVDGQ